MQDSSVRLECPRKLGRGEAEEEKEVCWALPFDYSNDDNYDNNNGTSST